jgi:creatinine amidohydrolase
MVVWAHIHRIMSAGPRDRQAIIRGRAVPTREWADLTWEDVRDLDRSRMVAVLPVGALEAHGPHLPLGTDNVIAIAMARAAIAALEPHGIGGVLLPALPYTAAPFGAAFAGTLSVSPGACAALIADLAAEVGRHGFAALAIANAHLDPAHLGALAQAQTLAGERRAAPVICPDLTRRPWAERLTEEFRSGACHAGRYEGSVVLAERPELVRTDVQRSLPPVPASLASAIRAGATTFEQAGGPRAYFGWPADATADEGAATIAALGGILADAVRAALAPGRAT